jgi:hypothetical protein
MLMSLFYLKKVETPAPQFLTLAPQKRPPATFLPFGT